MNPYKALKGLLPDPPLLVGTVTAVVAGVATVELPDGGEVSARGTAVVGQQVFVRAGTIEGTAPILPVEIIQI